MRKIERTPAPEFLQKNYKKWGKRYKAKRNNPAKSNEFRWAQHEGKKVNEHLLPLLQAMTNYHCSFCDGFPLGTTGETIEHFRSVSAFPLLSYVWANLFYCCNYCNNTKGQEPERKLLRPDQLSYDFANYFIFDYETGKIEASPRLFLPEKEKAENTIRLYGLNNFNRPLRRKQFWRLFQKMEEPDVEDFPYRFILL